MYDTASQSTFWAAGARRGPARLDPACHYPTAAVGKNSRKKPASRGRTSVPRSNTAVAPKLHTHRTPQLPGAIEPSPDAVDPSQVYVIGGKEFSTEQVVGLVFGFYCVLGFLGTRGGSKKEEPKAAESAPAAGGSVVSMLDDGFEAWAANPSNMKKWEDSIAEMK
jgi:hypothetical protein